MALASLSTKATSEAGIPVKILHPKTNIPLGFTITACGTDSETYKKAQRKQLNRRLEHSQRNRNNKIARTAEEMEAEGLDILIACTKAWHTGDRPEIEMNEGEWLPCTPENVRQVYEDFAWIKEQVDQEIGDRANFLPE
jgi:hypothetical protein